MSIYLDYAAATPIDPEILTAMGQVEMANPASLHSAGRRAQAELEEARRGIAQILGANPLEVVFTSGSTEGINLAMRGVMSAHPDGNMIISSLEHDSVLKTAKAIAAKGADVRMAEVSRHGVIELDSVAEAIDDQTVLVCLQYVNNEIGTVQPVSSASKIIQKVRTDRSVRRVDKPLYLFCDAAQAGLMSLQVSRLGVDLLSMSGLKIYGPHGTGFLYVKSGVVLNPLFSGGGEVIRPGTPDTPGAAGLAFALKLIQENRKEESRRLSSLTSRAIKGLNSIIGLSFNAKSTLPGLLNFKIQGVPGETMLAYLDAAGFAVATGAACSAGSEEPSHVLKGIGLSREQAETSIRISFGRYTTQEEVDGLIDAVHKTIPKARR